MSCEWCRYFDASNLKHLNGERSRRWEEGHWQRSGGRCIRNPAPVPKLPIEICGEFSFAEIFVSGRAPWLPHLWIQMEEGRKSHIARLEENKKLKALLKKKRAAQ